MSRLTRDGTAESVSRDQILRREREQGNIHFSVQPTKSRISNRARVILTLATCDDNNFRLLKMMSEVEFNAVSKFDFIAFRRFLTTGGFESSPPFREELYMPR